MATLTYPEIVARLNAGGVVFLDCGGQPILIDNVGDIPGDLSNCGFLERNLSEYIIVGNPTNGQIPSYNSTTQKLQWSNAASGGGTWGSITGTLSNQTDLQSELNLKANLASPTFTGIPLAPTAASNTNTTQLATTAFVQTAISNLINAAPTQLDTLNELAAALGNDANFATTITNQLAGKQPLGNYITDLTGDVTATGPNSVTATVTRLQGRSIASTAPTNGQALIWNNALSQWEPQTIIGMGIGNAITGATAGSVLFAGVGGVLAQDNAALRFDTQGHFYLNTAGATNVALNVSPTANTGFVTAAFTGSQAIGTGFRLSSTAAGGRSYALISTGNAAGPGGGTFSLFDESVSTYRWVVASSGQFGINTTSPSAQMHAVASASNVIGAIVQGAVSQSANLTEWRNSAGVALSVVDASGKFGIGTSAPQRNLDVVGNGGYPGVFIRNTASISTNLESPFSLFLGPTLEQSTDRFYQIKNRSFDGVEGTFLITYWNGSTYNERMRIDATGKVGIGTASPASLLSVGANSEFQVRSNGSIKPAAMTDAAAANDSIYYSTTQNKLCYKDSSGVSNPLY